MKIKNQHESTFKSRISTLVSTWVSKESKRIYFKELILILILIQI